MPEYHTDSKCGSCGGELEREIADSHFCSRYRAILLDAAKQTVQQL